MISTYSEGCIKENITFFFRSMYNGMSLLWKINVCVHTFLYVLFIILGTFIDHSIFIYIRNNISKLLMWSKHWELISRQFLFPLSTNIVGAYAHKSASQIDWLNVTVIGWNGFEQRLSDLSALLKYNTRVAAVFPSCGFVLL